MSSMHLLEVLVNKDVGVQNAGEIVEIINENISSETKNKGGCIYYVVRAGKNDLRRSEKKVRPPPESSKKKLRPPPEGCK